LTLVSINVRLTIKNSYRVILERFLDCTTDTIKQEAWRIKLASLYSNHQIELNSDIFSITLLILLLHQIFR